MHVVVLIIGSGNDQFVYLEKYKYIPANNSV